MGDEVEQSSQPSAQPGQFSALLGDLGCAKHWSGGLKEGCNRFCSLVGGLIAASDVLVLRRSASGDLSWRGLARWSSNTTNPSEMALLQRQAPMLADACFLEGPICRAFVEESASGKFCLAARLPLDDSLEQLSVLVLLGPISEEKATDAQSLLVLASEIPNLCLMRLAVSRAKQHTRNLSWILDLVAQVSNRDSFVSAAMSLCNALAKDCQCEQVGLGWLDGERIRFCAASRTEQIDSKKESSSLLIAAMEECFDQNEIIVVPDQRENAPLIRDHERYQRLQESTFLCSVPVLLGERIVGVVTSARSMGAFPISEAEQIQLGASLLASRLSDLRRKDRWVGAKLKDGIESWGKKFVGPEKTGTKLLAILFVLGSLLLAFVRVPYRVEANFILKSDETFYQTAPFDGFIESVSKQEGDSVQAGETLLKLDTARLELEEASVLAELRRHQRESEKARAARRLADMRVSLALSEQSEAQLEQIHWRLEQSNLRSPMEGTLIEGDLKERLGAPVKEGEILFRIARVDQFYVDAELREQDIDNVQESYTGEITFVSRPGESFGVKIDLIEPAAEVKGSENVFSLRAEITDSGADWFRPGLSGVCKVEAGRRTLWWIATHRTVDFLRLYFWW